MLVIVFKTIHHKRCQDIYQVGGIKQELRHTICGEQTNLLFPALRQQLTAYIHLGMHLQHCGIDSLRI